MTTQQLAARWLFGIILVGCLALAGLPENLRKGRPVAGSSVRVELPTGLGSGVYIGGGLVITAAHVVGDNPTVRLVSDAGGSQVGEVVWVNKTYDIAAIRPASPEAYQIAALACRDAIVGESITGEGNPDGIEFLSFKGTIAGKAREFLPNWKSAYVINMTVSSGMSGGPSYDQFGEVIGINVGVADPHGEQGKPSTGGMGFTVPSSVVCSLLGRA